MEIFSNDENTTEFKTQQRVPVIDPHSKSSTGWRKMVSNETIDIEEGKRR